jgi:pimeloyl-ACP methyl ester carboxylesterase
MIPKPPRLEGTVRLPDGRTLGFAEFGPPDGKPIFWFHGTPGARRQIPPEARVAAHERGVRLIGVDRPGIGDSTPHLYPSLTAWAHDIAAIADRLGIGRFGLIGLSGGGPYVLACAHALPERVVAGAILGGVAPTQGPDAPAGGLVPFAAQFEPLYRYLHEPLGVMLTALVWLLRPAASPAFNLYMRFSPAGDRAVFARPEMKAMFIDDLMHGSRWGLRAPIYDLLLFSHPWGFRLRDIRVPIRFWHGDADHLVPLAHGRRLAELVPNATLSVRPGESHLGGLAAAEHVLDTILSLWPGASTAKPRAGKPRRAARPPGHGAAPVPAEA